MSKTNQVFLNQIFDDVCKFATNCISTPTITTGGEYKTPGCHPTTLEYYFDYRPWDYTDWSMIYNAYSWKSDNSIPSYPVSNYKLSKDGTSIIEIAVTGFDEDEIVIKKHDLKIIVTGKKKEKSKDSDYKYLYKNIGTRDFELEFSGSDQWDYDKIEADISKGVLTISVPVKEDCKPITIPIKKK